MAHRTKDLLAEALQLSPEARAALAGGGSSWWEPRRPTSSPQCARRAERTR